MARSYENRTFNRYSARIERGDRLNELEEQTYQELSNEDCFTLIGKLGEVFSAGSSKLIELSISDQELIECEDQLIDVLQQPGIEILLEKILRAEASATVRPFR